MELGPTLALNLTLLATVGIGKRWQTGIPRIFRRSAPSAEAKSVPDRMHLG